MIDPATAQKVERIIFLPFVDAFGGVERLVLDLVRFLENSGASPTIACFRRTINLQTYADFPIRTEQLSPSRNSFSEARALARYLGSKRSAGGTPLLFDLKSAFYSGVVSPGPFSLHLTDPPSLLPADVSKRAPSARKRVSEFENLPPAGLVGKSHAEVVHRLNRRGVRRAQRVIVMTGKIREELKQLYGVDATIIRPGVAALNSSVSPVPTSKLKPLRMLSVSRLEPGKRIDWILRALSELDASGSLIRGAWVLEVAGQGPQAEALKDLTRELGLLDHVFFLGHVSEEELAKAYARANLFLMPAVQGYGLPALEALQRGLPTIVHQDSGVSEILGSNPWVCVIGGDNGSLARAIGTMAEQIAGTANLAAATKPHIPTADEWARQVSEACGWL